MYFQIQNLIFLQELVDECRINQRPSNLTCIERIENQLEELELEAVASVLLQTASDVLSQLREAEVK